ncbi:MAG: RsmE family RNA methyltransferase, partial [Anaeromyxobacteraceae bacterium]
MKRRIHVPRERIEGATARLDAPGRHYLQDVLRLEPGAAVEVFDGRGGLYDACVEPGFERLALGPRRDAPPGGAPIHLALALAKGEKIDLVVQKATELGAARIVPWEAARSVVRLEGERAEERAKRWRRIAEEAARQCGRADVPEVRVPATLVELVAEIPPGFLPVVFHGEGSVAVARLPDADGVVAIVGPEGGLTAAEVGTLSRAGAAMASLGPR